MAKLAHLEPLRAPEGSLEGSLAETVSRPAPGANADENVDGKISLEEWKHATARRFTHLDKARTGKLILTDLILPKDKQPKDDKRGKPPTPSPGGNR
jgi:hypothetical protein